LEARDQWRAGSMEQSGVNARIGAWIAHVPLRDAVNDRQRYLMSRALPKRRRRLIRLGARHGPSAS